jgi:DNA-binding NarL/FixJ family response regulator
MSSDSDAIRILTVDDHPVLRDGIASLIADESDMLIAGEAANGREAIEQFRRLHPDVTLMDLQMPENERSRRADRYSRRVP